MTPREEQILALVHDDPLISQAAIARQLGISRSATPKTHGSSSSKWPELQAVASFAERSRRRAASGSATWLDSSVVSSVELRALKRREKRANSSARSASSWVVGVGHCCRDDPRRVYHLLRAAGQSARFRPCSRGRRIVLVQFVEAVRLRPLRSGRRRRARRPGSHGRLPRRCRRGARRSHR